MVGSTPEQYAEHLHRETVKWVGVIKTAGINHIPKLKQF